jgi:NADPH:quinone reductase-like Zn-dependent oxidoreductase
LYNYFALAVYILSVGRKGNMQTMKAVRIHEYGDPSVLCYEDAPRPVPREGDVLIRMHATTVNPFDIAVRAGYMSGYFNYTLPLILGTDVAGEIVEAGRGVTNFSPGDAVYTRAGVFRDGSYAEYVIAPAADVAKKPKTLGYFESAALPHVTLTAWQALYELGNLQPGQTVLIHGAAGGVGHMAVQLAKLRGAKVIGTASVNYDQLKKLGVDQAINYMETPFESVAHDVDIVLDTVGGDTQERSWQTLKKGGILISTVQPPSEETAAAHGVRQAMVSTAPPIAATLTEVARLVDSGQLKPVVSKVLSLQEVCEAHEMLASRHTHGKIVIKNGV